MGQFYSACSFLSLIHICGEVEAYGQVAAAGIGSGGSPNRKPDRKEDDPKYARSEDSLDLTIVEITGGLVTAAGGPMGGAGIGAGAGADQCEVRISGGEVKAWGSSSAREEMWGGAGIGSGAYLASDSYHTPTVTEVSISGNAEVIATGGWGAAGAGSGAENQRADVRIDVYKRQRPGRKCPGPCQESPPR